MTAALRVAITLEQCWHQVPGGTARAALELVDSVLARPEGDVDLVGVAARHSQPPKDDFRPAIDVRHVPLPRLGMYEAWHWLRWPPVERVTGPVHVVHATGIAMPPSRGPIVSTLHDLAFLRFPDLYTRRGNQFFRRALELTRRHAALVACSSVQTQQDCIAAGIAAERTVHVPLGARIVSVTPEHRSEVRRKHALERPFILWTGTREPRKNLLRLVEAYERSTHRSDVDLVLVGPSGWHHDRTGLADGPPRGVRVLGFLPPTELAALYEECDVFAFPSLLEGFGLPVLEAMGHGAPVITSRGTATEEIASGNARLVDPTDTDDIAAALDDLLADEAGRRSLGEAGPAIAARFTWEEHAARMVEVYRRVSG